jgi:ABC-2 type transport system ATP-binding protein
MVSFLPDANHLFKWMKVKDAIAFYQDFFKDFDINKAKELLDFMDLSENSSMTQLSKGMIEKLNLVLVLARKAKLFLFDEPLGGVDPSAREKIIDAIIKTCGKENSMVISTHLVKDIERLFHNVAFLSEGNIVLQGNAEQLKTEKGKSIDEIFREVF